MTKPGMRRWFRRVAVLALLAEAAVAVALYPEQCLGGLAGLFVHMRPLRYDQPFARIAAQADRIVVRNGGFDCGPALEDNVLFAVTNKDEVAEMVAHLAFEPRVVTNSFWEVCLCSGNLRIDWYKGRHRLARTALIHGAALRWRGFTTVRILGFRFGHGDGPFTRKTRTWMREWFVAHVPGRENRCPAAPAVLSAAETPGEVGRRVAMAMRTGDTEGLEELFPPYEAARPRFSFKEGVFPGDEGPQRDYADKLEWIQTVVAGFPREFEEATSNRMDQVIAVEVEREQRTGNKNFADVDLVFRTANAQYVLVADCLCWNNRWYLFDLYWLRRE